MLKKGTMFPFLLLGAVQMVIAKESKVELIGFSMWDIILRWTSFDDFDLLVVYEGEDQQRGVVYFTETGVADGYPYLLLNDEVDFSSTEKDNELSVTVFNMAVQKIWIFGWAFEYMLDRSKLDFADCGIHVVLQNQEKKLQTSAHDLIPGNLCRFGAIYKDEQEKIWFHNQSDCFTVDPFQEIEELYSFLS